jgi:hypothetical protein
MIPISELEKQLRENFEDRLKLALANHSEDQTASETKKIVSLAEELHEISDSHFWSIFREFGNGSLRTIEGIEGFQFFIRNFFDDSVFRLEKTQTESDYYIVLSNDDHPNNLTEETLLTFLEKELTDAKTYQKWCAETEKW